MGYVVVGGKYGRNEKKKGKIIGIGGVSYIKLTRFFYVNIMRAANVGVSMKVVSQF